MQNFCTVFSSLFQKMAKKGKGKKSGKKDKGGKGTRTPVMVDGVAAEEMTQEQLVEHVGRMREEVRFYIIQAFI